MSLRDDLNEFAGTLDLTDYAHPLPAGLASVGGQLKLTGYAHPLPAALKHVGGGVSLAFADQYHHSLAQLGLESAGDRLRKNPRRTSRKPPRKTSRKPVRKTSKHARRKTSRR